MAVAKVILPLNVYLEHQRWDSTPSSSSGHNLRGSLRQCGSEPFGDGDLELRFTACIVLPGTHILQKNVLHVCGLSYPTVTLCADVVKQCVCHVRSCLQEAFHHSADDEPGFTS